MRRVLLKSPAVPGRSFSYSSFRAILECTLKYHFQHVEKRPAPQPPIFVVGSALHYMTYRFFRVMYKTAESFCGAWAHFFRNVAEGEHGPGGFRDRPVQIAWKFDKEQWYWNSRGKEVLTKFFERHKHHRRTGMAAAAEVRFRLSDWRGLSLSGVIDRIDDHGDHVAIVDYKMGLYPPYMLGVKGSYQATFYQLAYEHLLFRRFGGKPLTAMTIENLFTGASQEFNLRSGEDIDEFYADLIQASNYLRSIYSDWTPPPSLQTQIHRFPVDTNGRFRLWPRLPRDPGHCSTCSYVDACIAWVDQHRSENQLPDAVRWWQDRRRQLRAQAMPNQEELPLVSP
ncbi:MAG: PD-(D/E)XK nuclease family protein [Patescibacteria group bacterium]